MPFDAADDHCFHIFQSARFGNLFLATGANRGLVSSPFGKRFFGVKSKARAMVQRAAFDHKSVVALDVTLLDSHLAHRTLFVIHTRIPRLAGRARQFARRAQVLARAMEIGATNNHTLVRVSDWLRASRTAATGRLVVAFDAWRVGAFLGFAAIGAEDLRMAELNNKESLLPQ